jgi:hypothetical protein
MVEAGMVEAVEVEAVEADRDTDSIIEYTEVGYRREGTRQTVCERLNDVWVRGCSAPNRLYWNTTCFSIQFVQVLTNLWYSHTYNFVTLAKLRPISKTVAR